MDLTRLLEIGVQLLNAEEKNEKWASSVCQWSAELHECVFEISPHSDFIKGEIIPLLKQLLDCLNVIKPKESCVKYVQGFKSNVGWRISELENYPGQRMEQFNSLPPLPLDF